MWLINLVHFTAVSHVALVENYNVCIIVAIQILIFALTNVAINADQTELTNVRIHVDILVGTIHILVDMMQFTSVPIMRHIFVM